MQNIYILLKVFNVFLFMPFFVKKLFDKAAVKLDFTIFYSYALSICLISWLYVLLLRVIPYQSHAFYIVSTALPFVLFFIYHYKEAYGFCARLYCSLKYMDIQNKIFAYLFFLVVVLIVLNYFNMPVLGNDSLQYIYLSKLINSLHDVSFYPSTSPVDLRGFIAPWSHPLGYPGLLAYAQLGLTDQHDAVLKLFSLSALLMTAFGMATCLFPKDRRADFFGATLLVATPLVFGGQLEVHVDTTRILMFFASFLFLYDYMKNASGSDSIQYDVKAFLILGILNGYGCFMHSSGILTYVMCIGSYLFVFLFRHRAAFFDVSFLRRQVILISLSTCVMLLIISIDLYKTIKVHGRILSDLENIKIYSYLKSDYASYLQLSRGLDDLSTKIVSGLGRIFTDIDLFGAGYILYLLILPFAVKNMLAKKELSIETMSHLNVLLFFSLALTCTFIGINTFVFNPRYLLQIQPIVCLAVACQLKRIW
ncbi:MAG: hypothetical protein C0514_08405 [Candidatus Puniceispirillum sp.]|nr:hypothetical protein [Candidatus Puniceispirillum sp.]